MNARTPRRIPVERWTTKDQSRWDSKVQSSEQSDCVNWIAGKTCGYGMFQFAGQFFRAHRIAYVRANGNPSDPESVIDHLCRNRACVNPGHLEAVPQWLNFARGNAWNTHYLTSPRCLRGHLMTESNTYIHKSGSRQCLDCQRMKPSERKTSTRGLILGTEERAS